MRDNHFVFADLSTFDVATAQKFYTGVLDWDFYTEDKQYWTAFHRAQEVAGLYLTPQKFQDMGMPSFWMSYIQVADVERTVEIAKEAGGIIELVDLQAAIGPIALIRDPMGAGFTVYGGDYLNSRYKNREGSLVWNELFISDFGKVAPFYSRLFGWTYEAETPSRSFIRSQEEIIGAVQELSNEVKGKMEYWGVFFAVKDVQASLERLSALGGKLIYQDQTFALVSDPFGAVFHLVPLDRY